MRIEIAGENSLILYFEDQALLPNNLHVSQFAQKLSADDPVWLVDVIPSYQSLLVLFNPYQTDFLAVKAFLKHYTSIMSSSEKPPSKIIELPVLYDHPMDNDIQRISQHSGISPQQVIALHTNQEYRVYAIGFAPGFAFLGEVSPLIATPRLATPRTRVPKGAVAIADRQTAVYPAASPGGWNVIGLCPTRLFEPQLSTPMPFSVGDRVKFSSIDESTFISLGGEIEHA